MSREISDIHCVEAIKCQRDCNPPYVSEWNLPIIIYCVILSLYFLQVGNPDEPRVIHYSSLNKYYIFEIYGAMKRVHS